MVPRSPEETLRAIGCHCAPRACQLRQISGCQLVFAIHGVKAELAKDGFTCLDQFDLVDTSKKGTIIRLLVRCVRAVGMLRLLGFICSDGTLVLGVKPSTIRG